VSNAKKRSHGLPGIALAVVFSMLAMACSFLDDEDDLQAGDCVSQIPVFAGGSVDRTDCERGAYRILSNTAAEDGDYPGNLESLAIECEERGGLALLPSRETWNEGGDRNVLCYSLILTDSSARQSL